MLAKQEVADRPISLGLLRQMHKVLMDSVRGADKMPGEFRREQNWIGDAGCPIEQATFVPPSPLRLMDYLHALETYIAGSDLDLLLQCAVVHAQFELIHPFKDGNGRIGRLLIPLFLYQKKALTNPHFYLSGYLESHREVYYARLQAISRDNDWSGWIAFFLEAVTQQALTNTQRVRAMMTLYENMKQRIVELTRSQYAIAVLDALFDKPIFQSADFVQRSGIPKQSSLPFLRTLRDAGILQVLREASGRRSAVFAFRELLNCAEGREVF